MWRHQRALGRSVEIDAKEEVAVMLLPDPSLPVRPWPVSFTTGGLALADFRSQVSTIVRSRVAAIRL